LPRRSPYESHLVPWLNRVERREEELKGRLEEATIQSSAFVRHHGAERSRQRFASMEQEQGDLFGGIGKVREGRHEDEIDQWTPLAVLGSWTCGWAGRTNETPISYGFFSSISAIFSLKD